MKKIMFNDRYGLTEAVLDGSKTQTRRIMKGKPLFPSDEIESTGVLGDEVQIIANGGESLITMKLPFRVGEVVAVAQSYKDVDSYYSAAYQRQHSIHGMTVAALDCVPNEDIKKWFKNRNEFNDKASWDNKMFVKSELMPHQIRITDVRVERLQDISDEDCLKEGVVKWDAGQKDISFFSYPNSAKCDYDTPQEAFAHLINKVSKKDVWQENPYVLVYDFKLVK